MNEIGIKLKQSRLAKRLNLSNVETETGIKISNLSRYENGARISANDVAKLCQLYGISSDYVLGLSGRQMTRTQDIEARETWDNLSPAFQATATAMLAELATLDKKTRIAKTHK